MSVMDFARTANKYWLLTLDALRSQSTASHIERDGAVQGHVVKG
jgi:hypothetical protein